MVDLKKLREQNVLWLIIDNQVYDVSGFQDHPGGFEIFNENKGLDATKKFKEANHPDYVQEDLKKYLLGDVAHIPQEEVAKHKVEGDAWLAIHNKVYDVSQFLDHPGGAEILFDASGKDATKDFEDIDHSVSARKDLEKHFLGHYIPGDPTVKTSYNSVIIIALIIAILGISLRFLIG